MKEEDPSDKEKMLEKISLSQKIVKILCNHPNEKLNTRQIAAIIVNQYPEEYRIKRKNPRFKDDKSFMLQLAGEVNSTKEQVINRNKHIFWQNTPKPRVYWYNPDKTRGSKPNAETGKTDKKTVSEDTFIDETTITHLKRNLYPASVRYL